jgi:hypothetical protein
MWGKSGNWNQGINVVWKMAGLRDQQGMGKKRAGKRKSGLGDLHVINKINKV